MSVSAPLALHLPPPARRDESEALGRRQYVPTVASPATSTLALALLRATLSVLVEQQQNLGVGGKARGSAGLQDVAMQGQRCAQT